MDSILKFEVRIESTSKRAISDYSWSSPSYPIFLWRTYRRVSLPRQLLVSRTNSQVSLALRAAPVMNSHGGLHRDSSTGTGILTVVSGLMMDLPISKLLDGFRCIHGLIHGMMMIAQ